MCVFLLSRPESSIAGLVAFIDPARELSKMVIPFFTSINSMWEFLLLQIINT